MDETWAHDFEAFFAHVGPRPSPLHSIDRISPNIGYHPGNLRWATRKQQNNNRRDTIHLTYQGKTLTLMEWAQETGISPYLLRERIYLGFPEEKIFSNLDFRFKENKSEI